MSANSEFKVGVIVKLNSGGPEMTIQEICVNFSTHKPTGDVDCQWFAGKKLERGRFPIASLELVKAQAKPA